MNNASFAMGYVTAEDRMWQMDILRHAGRGTLTEFVGEDFLPMDIVTRREGYTEVEIREMFDSFDEKFGADGVAIQEGLQAYADGVNAHIEELKTTRADEMPVEYTATGNPPPAFPEEWTPANTLFLVVLQLRTFGETAGGELENAALYAQLRKKLGKKKGAAAFEDFLRQGDPRSYTSIAPRDGVFRSQNLGKVNPKALAIPDHAAGLAEQVASEEAARDKLLKGLGFKAPASNALLVSAVWYDKLVDEVFADELGANGGAVPAPVFDHDMWFDFSSYLKNVFSPKARKKLARNYCDKLGTPGKETCVQASFSALLSALTELRTDQGNDMAQWKADAEWIEFQEFGAGSAERIPWQNRGTHNQVIEILEEAD